MILLPPAGDIELSVRSKSPEPVVPEMVQGLEVTQLPGQQLAMSVSWKPPQNVSSPQDISHYYIRVSSKITSKVVRNLELEGSITEVEVGEKDGMEPLHEYIFAVQALSCDHKPGDWSMTEGIISKSAQCYEA